MNLSVGSGDIAKLMQDEQTQGYQDLLRKFVSDEKPIYNAFASPIDALRTGAILEKSYLQTLDESYYSQYKVTCQELNVLTSSIDFAKIDKDSIVDFDELKTIYFTDFIDLILPLKDKPKKEYTEFLKKKFKKNYEQIQAQLLCSQLESANLVFLCVESYIDEENYNRVLNENDFVKFRIDKDKSIIDKIKNKLQIFQTIKNHFTK